MTTEHMAETTEKSPNINKKLAKVSCPFTWDIEVGCLVEPELVAEEKKNLYQIILDRQDEVSQIKLDQQDYFPEKLFVYQLVMAFGHASANDLPKAIEYINKSEECLADIKEKATLKNVETVLDHIFIGTKCHVLNLQDRLPEMDELLEGIVAVCNMNKMELGMLNGCKALASLSGSAPDGMTITCLKKAIELDSNNGKWYFVLGEIRRDARKAVHSLAQKPGPEETSAFEKAYTLSPNVLFGVSLAQLYRESRDLAMANKIYKEVHALQPTCCTVRLQLALGFIRAHECELAKECLDYVAEKDFISSRYTHYMGIYEEKCNRDFKAALPYYESTIEKYNWVAEFHYLNCRRKVEPHWDPLPHMLSWLEKYEGCPEHIAQDVYVHIGSYYLFELRDIPAACKYLVVAILIQPNSKRLKEHWIESRKIQVDLYQVLANEVQTVLRDDVAKYDDKTIRRLKQTQQLCSMNCKYVPPHRALSISGSSSSQSSRGYQNRGQGSSSYPGTSGRTERSSQWRSDSSRGNEHRSATNFRYSSVRRRDASPIISWRLRDKKDENVAEPTSELVKNVRDIRL